MYWVLLILAVIAAVAGGALLSNATQGVGIIAEGCFLAIVARIVQAEVHERRRRREQQVRPTAAIEI